MLGFSENSFAAGATHTSDRACNAFVDHAYIFVYTNLVRERMVGDKEAQLLRTIPLYHDYGEATHEFVRTHYVPASGFDSDIVEVDIRTDTGAPAAFVDGKVLLTLRLRRKGSK